MRLCLDPKDLNQAIKRPPYFTPTLEDVLPKLNGAKCFSILDASREYWNIRLDQERSLHTTFNSPFGRYRFLRLRFVLICTQDVFQRKVDETFGDLAEVQVTLLCMATKVSSVTMMKTFLLSSNVPGRLVYASTWINATSVAPIPFFGDIVGADGLQPEPRKIDCILSKDPSPSLADAQSFLGLVQFLSCFIPNLATAAADLWGLTKKTSEFICGPEHQSAEDRVKQLITAPTVLQYFDRAQALTIQVDDSQRG